jgi:hypothetical protein
MPDPTPKAPPSDISANFEELLKTLDEEFARLPFKMLEKFRFNYEGLEFDVKRVKHDDAYRFLVTATIGYMPFSIEAIERREAIKAIISAAQTLPNVRFGVSTGSQISACALFDATQIVAPDFIFYPLVLFMQEAGPFIQLIGKYLIAPPLQQPVPLQESVLPAAENTGSYTELRMK